MDQGKDKGCGNGGYSGYSGEQNTGRKNGNGTVVDLGKYFVAPQHDDVSQCTVPSIVQMVRMSETLATCSASQYWSNNESSCSLTEVPRFFLLTPPTDTSSLAVSTENKRSVYNFVASLSDCTAHSVGWLEPKGTACIPDSKRVSDIPTILITPPTPELSLLDITEKEKTPESLSTLTIPTTTLKDNGLKLESTVSGSSFTNVTMEDIKESLSDLDLSSNHDFTSNATLPIIVITRPTPNTSLTNILDKASQPAMKSIFHDDLRPDFGLRSVQLAVSPTPVNSLCDLLKEAKVSKHVSNIARCKSAPSSGLLSSTEDESLMCKQSQSVSLNETHKMPYKNKLNTKHTPLLAALQRKTNDTVVQSSSCTSSRSCPALPTKSSARAITNSAKCTMAGNLQPSLSLTIVIPPKKNKLCMEKNRGSGSTVREEMETMSPQVAISRESQPLQVT